MKFLMSLLIVVTSPVAFAASPELLASCKLSALDESVQVEGQVQVTKTPDQIDINTHLKITEDKEVNEGDYSDTIPTVNTYTGKALEDMAKSDEVVQVLVERLGSEKPVEYTLYMGKNMSDDGSGLALMRLKGAQGTVKGLTLIGWSGAYCD